MGNRFIIDKENDKINAQNQIAKTSFQERNHDLTKENINQVK